MTKLEYIGDLKFGRATGTPSTPASIEQWNQNAREQFELIRAIRPILQGTDEEVEQMLREADDPAEKYEQFEDLIELCAEWEDRYKAGAEIMGAAHTRLLIVCERYQGRDKMEKLYAS